MVALALNGQFACRPGGGASLLIAPSLFLAIFGQAETPAVTVYARLYGAELLGFSVATWLVRNASPDGQLPIVYGHVVNESLMAIVIVAAAVSGVGNMLVWAIAVLPTAFAVAFAVAALRLSRGRKRVVGGEGLEPPTSSV